MKCSKCGKPMVFIKHTHDHGLSHTWSWVCASHDGVEPVPDKDEPNHYEQALKAIMKVCENSRAYTEAAQAYFIAKKALEHGKKE